MTDDHEPLDPNIPHPDIPQIDVTQTPMCVVATPVWMSGYASGYIRALSMLLPNEAAAEQTFEHMQELSTEVEFLNGLHAVVHQVLDDTVAKLATEGGPECPQ